MPAIPQDLLDEAACYGCFGINLGTALELALLDRISDEISSGGETFFRLSDVGDTRISAIGDTRIWT